MLEQLAEEKGDSIPPRLRVHTVQNASDLVHVPLPGDQAPSGAENRLSDDQLEDISGGEIFVSVLIILIIGASSSSSSATVAVAVTQGAGN